MINVIRRHPVVSFILLTMGITYLIGLPLVFALGPIEESLGWPEGLLSLRMMAYGPTIAGLAIALVVGGHKAILVWFAQLFRWQVNPAYYLFIFLSAPILFLTHLIMTLGIDATLSMRDGATPEALPGLLWSYIKEIGYRIIVNGEEGGWRFAMTTLLLVQMRLFPASLIVGIVWAFWHAPAFFLFGQATDFYPLIPICLGFAFTLAWLYKATNSLLLPVIAHGVWNATTYSFEKHFVDLNSKLEALVPLGDFNYAILGLVIAAGVVVCNYKLFFGQVEQSPSEDWARSKK